MLVQLHAYADGEPTKMVANENHMIHPIKRHPSSGSIHAIDFASQGLSNRGRKEKKRI